VHCRAARRMHVNKAAVARDELARSRERGPCRASCAHYAICIPNGETRRRPIMSDTPHRLAQVPLAQSRPPGPTRSVCSRAATRERKFKVRANGERKAAHDDGRARFEMNPTMAAPHKHTRPAGERSDGRLAEIRLAEIASSGSRSMMTTLNTHSRRGGYDATAEISVRSASRPGHWLARVSEERVVRAPAAAVGPPPASIRPAQSAPLFRPRTANACEIRRGAPFALLRSPPHRMCRPVAAAGPFCRLGPAATHSAYHRHCANLLWPPRENAPNL
jgi:hypothetical protein